MHTAAWLPIPFTSNIELTCFLHTSVNIIYTGQINELLITHTHILWIENMWHIHNDDKMACVFVCVCARAPHILRHTAGSSSSSLKLCGHIGPSQLCDDDEPHPETTPASPLSLINSNAHSWLHPAPRDPLACSPTPVWQLWSSLPAMSRR